MSGGDGPDGVAFRLGGTIASAYATAANGAGGTLAEVACYAAARTA